MFNGEHGVFRYVRIKAQDVACRSRIAHRNIDPFRRLQ
jgi:hypothetical protein